MRTFSKLAGALLLGSGLLTGGTAAYADCNNNTGTETVLGAGAGAAVGGLASHSVAGAVIGGVGGGLIGNAIASPTIAPTAEPRRASMTASAGRPTTIAMSRLRRTLMPIAMTVPLTIRTKTDAEI